MLWLLSAMLPSQKAKDAKLAGKISDAFTELQHELDKHKDGDGYVFTTLLTRQAARPFFRRINALRPPWLADRSNQ